MRERNLWTVESVWWNMESVSVEREKDSRKEEGERQSVCQKEQGCTLPPSLRDCDGRFGA